jgi:hypothetical protein
MLETITIPVSDGALAANVSCTQSLSGLPVAAS